jgi:uncharacterized protein YciI
MFVVLLRFGRARVNAREHLAGHQAWIQRGFEQGVFLVVGSLEPKLGGAILAYNTTRAELEARVNDDPFVAESVVEAEILELSPAKADERLAFLLG